jgi:hypothetical protein
VAQLAEAVVRLLLDRNLRREMGLNGKRKIEAECSSEVIARKTIEVYRRAVGGDVRRPTRAQIEPSKSAAVEKQRVSAAAKQ